MWRRALSRVNVWLSPGLCFAAGAGLAAVCSLAAQAEIRLRFEPHGYAGVRNEEPQFQSVVQSFANWSGSGVRNWAIRLRWEMETFGRRDYSLDVDRAWVAFDVERHRLVFGRIHPFELSSRPDSKDGWSLSAVQQPRAFGLLLGSGFDESAPLPTPTRMGWVGAHFWSDSANSATLAWGASFSPIFLPDRGAEVTYSETEPASAARFGRRPPGTVNVDGVTYPLRYRLDSSQLLEDVLLNPQASIQARWRHRTRLPMMTWFHVERSPSPSPRPDTTGYLRVSETGIHAVAEVTPKFPYRWLGSLTHEFRSRIAGGQSALRAGVLAEVNDFGERTYGFELGARWKGLRAGYSHAWTGTGDQSGATGAQGRFLEHLLRAELQVPVRALTFSGGLISQLQQRGSIWLHGSIGWRVNRDFQLRVGGDLFGGDDGTYFSEWRTNDRVFGAISWRAGP